MNCTRGIIIGAMLAVLGIGAAGCYFGPPHRHVMVGPPRSVVLFHYWYYPDVEVYFDYEHEVYFYLRSGVWVSVKVLPATIILPRDRYVILELDTDAPYRYHKRHRKSYPPGKPIKRMVPAPRPKADGEEKEKKAPEPKAEKELKSGKEPKVEKGSKPKNKPQSRGKGKGRGGPR